MPTASQSLTTTVETGKMQNTYTIASSATALAGAPTGTTANILQKSWLGLALALDAPWRYCTDGRGSCLRLPR
eukprot:2407562-Pyramimonas_sp.AAC.1